MLKTEELFLIKGGAINWVVIGIIGTLITFIAGIVDGYLRPLKCDE